jgi:hypothetical protein
MKFTVTATSPQGFPCHLELEGEKVYADALKLLAQLEKDGFTYAPEGHQIDAQPFIAGSSPMIMIANLPLTTTAGSTVFPSSAGLIKTPDRSSTPMLYGEPSRNSGVMRARGSQKGGI